MGRRIDVLRQSLFKPVVLIGLMGVGKSEIGRRLADALSWEFVDSDAAIETAEGRPITDIFSQSGEPYFRALEQDIVQDLLEGKARVVSLGGGAVMQEAVARRVKEKAVSVWLDTDIDILAKRLEGDKGRPLLAGQSPHAVLTDLYEKRKSAYEKADRTVKGNGTVEKVLDNVITALHDYCTT